MLYPRISPQVTRTSPCLDLKNCVMLGTFFSVSTDTRSHTHLMCILQGPAHVTNCSWDSEAVQINSPGHPTLVGTEDILHCSHI
jgi:hypothetical protein